MTPNKVCPVLIRKAADDWQILVFHHPLAGDQLVKGTIEKNETEESAALRELAEESGINSAEVVRSLGVWKTEFDGQIWSILLCRAENLPDEWTFHTDDGGGQDFAFFWHSLNSDSGNFHPVYQSALAWIKKNLFEIQSENFNL